MLNLFHLLSLTLIDQSIINKLTNTGCKINLYCDENKLRHNLFQKAFSFFIFLFYTELYFTVKKYNKNIIKIISIISD